MCPPSNLASLSGQRPHQTPSNDTPIPTIVVPTDPISQAAYTHAARELHPTILKHSIRVFLHARQISIQESLVYHGNRSVLRLLFTACLFHDIGTSQTYNTGPTRFEIEGADAAVSLLTSGVSGSSKFDAPITTSQIHDVWTAVAMHDTPQIAERIHPLARLVRLGVTIDFKRSAALALVSEEWVREVEDQFPRGDTEKVLGDGVVKQALDCPEKAPAACWPGGLLRAKLAEPEWEGVNKAF